MPPSTTSNNTSTTYGAISSTTTTTDEEEEGIIAAAIAERDDDDDDGGGGDDELDLEKDRSIHSNRQDGIISTIRSTVVSAMVFGGDNASVRELAGQATVTSEVFNIAKNLVGAGVLSLPGGMAIYTDSPKACVSACLLITFFGVIFAYYCILIGRVCRITRAFSFGEAWEEAVGEKGALAVSIVIATYPALGCIGCSIILSETFQSLSETIGFPVGRVTCLLVITIVSLLPLCLLKNIAVLAPFSFLGILVTVLAAAAMVVRYLDGSYLPDGQYFSDIPDHFQPSFGDRHDLVSLRVLPFICMIFSAYVMHYNSPRFYVELQNPTVPRFTKAVSGAFGLSTAIYLVMAIAGFLTFGGNSDGLILNNYSPHDPIASFCRIAIAISVLLNFPVSFIGFRDAILDVFKIPIALQTTHNIDMLTVILLSIITAVAASVTNLGMVNALAGGIFGILIVFVFPTVMLRSVLSTAIAVIAKESNARDVGLATGLMVMGIVLGVFGTIMSLVAG